MGGVLGAVIIICLVGIFLLRRWKVFAQARVDQRSIRQDPVGNDRLDGVSGRVKHSEKASINNSEPRSGTVSDPRETNNEESLGGRLRYPDDSSSLPGG